MSTNTTNMKFIKPDPGADTGNWGNLLNVSMDSLDRALTGLLQVSCATTPVTITAIDTTTDTTSRSPMYEFTGNQSANGTVYVPETPRSFWVLNSTTGGSYTLTVDTALNPGVSVVVPRGVFVNLVYTGSNMYAVKALTSVLADTATAWATGRTIALTGGATGTSASWTGSANVTIPAVVDYTSATNTGTLPVNRGGTGVTTSTGTGSVVLSASPVFTGNMELPATAKVTSSGGVAYYADSANTGGKMYISSSSGPGATAGTDGDIWMQY